MELKMANLTLLILIIALLCCLFLQTAGKRPKDPNPPCPTPRDRPDRECNITTGSTTPRTRGPRSSSPSAGAPLPTNMPPRLGVCPNTSLGLVTTPCMKDFPECIPISMICDGESQCKGGEDELYCGGDALRSNCDALEIPCRVRGGCLPAQLVCDRTEDCPDGTDEVFCGSHRCLEGSVPSPCPGTTVCIEKKKLCNYVSDCADSEDETSIIERGGDCETDLRFVHFGTALDDTLLITDDLSGPFDLEHPVVFYRSGETQLYVSQNGILTFRNSLPNTSPTLLPHIEHCNVTSGQCFTPIIAPFWAELNFDENNGSTYIQISVAAISQREYFVELVASENPIFSDVELEFMITVTWFRPDVPQAQSTGGDIGFFQTVLFTDGVRSFAVFVYANHESVARTRDRVVGFDAGDGNRSTTVYSLNSRDSDSTMGNVNAFRIDGECVTTVSDACGPQAFAAACEPLLFSASLCQCMNPGQLYNETNKNCEDIDECHSSPCPGSAVCVNSAGGNSAGGFHCICDPTGFTGDGVETCEDIDECASDLHDCPEICVNTIGGYNCSCEDGFKLSEDGTCEDLDECDLFAPCGENSDCVNTLGSFMCNCPLLFEMSQDETSCEASLTRILVVSGLGVLVVVTVVTLVLVSVVCYRRIKKKKAMDANIVEFEMVEPPPSARSRRRSSWEEFSIRQTVRNSFARHVPRSLVFPSARLRLSNTVGQGEFGLVYKGYLRRGDNEELVAIKTLKGFLQEHLVTDLLKECVKMQKFDHPNILKLIGVCLDGGPAPYIIMPFMPNGSLLSYLKQERDRLVYPDVTMDEDVFGIQNKLLDFCYQVAKGMEYLTSKRVVHRDLAARNCMIDMNFMIKVADFGLAESLDASKEYFRQESNTMVKLPIKWLAPECINDGMFSEKSDVWAYGVTCWEIFSGGKIPYPGIHPLELCSKLEMGHRMEKPLNALCPQEMYRLMKICWITRPDYRPCFTDLAVRLSYFLGNMCSYFHLLSITNPGIIDISPTSSLFRQKNKKRLDTDNYMYVGLPPGGLDDLSLPDISLADMALLERVPSTPGPPVPPRPKHLPCDNYIDTTGFTRRSRTIKTPSPSNGASGGLQYDSDTTPTGPAGRVYVLSDSEVVIEPPPLSPTDPNAPPKVLSCVVEPEPPSPSVAASSGDPTADSSEDAKLSEATSGNESDSNTGATPSETTAGPSASQSNDSEGATAGSPQPQPLDDNASASSQARADRPPLLPSSSYVVMNPAPPAQRAIPPAAAAQPVGPPVRPPVRPADDDDGDVDCTYVFTKI